MRNPFLSLLAMCFLLPPLELPAQVMTFKVRRDDSHIGFSISKWGIIKEEGRFRDFSGTIFYDPANPGRTRVEFTVQTQSIDSRNENRDRALRSEEFFYVTRYPTMAFRSTRTTLSEHDILLVEGDLTIRGITKRITVPVKILGMRHTGSELGTLVGFESQFMINREDFRVGEGWGIIGREATIQLLIGAGTENIASR